MSPPPRPSLPLRRNLAAALRQGDLDLAETLLEALKAEDPLSVETRGLELEYRLKRRCLAEADALGSQLATLFPASARILYLAGLAAYRQRRYAACEPLLRESQRLCDHWWTRRQLGKALSQLGRLDEAEAVLSALAESHLECLTDLAWVYERRGDTARALAAIDRYLAHRPDDEFARRQRLRLRAHSAEPRAVVEDVEGVLALGMDVPDEMLPEYVNALLATAQGMKLREFVAARLDALSPSLCARMAWVAYRGQAYDVALDLFLRAFDESRGNVKYLVSLESAARKCGRVEEVIRLYEAHAREERRLYGRARLLRRVAAGGSGPSTSATD